MQRLNEEKIVNIKKLKSHGLSLREIKNMIEIPLSTLQYNLNKNSGKTRIKDIKLPSSDFIKGELIGAFAGDGNYYHDKNGRSSHHRIKYCLSYKDDKDYADYLYKLIKDIGLNPWIFIKKKEGAPTGCEVTFYSVRFLRFIKEYLSWEGVKTYSVHLKENVNYKEEFLLGFARGLMDTDGFIDKYNLTLGCGCTSRKLIENLKKIFLKIGIPTNITIRKKINRKDLYLVKVYRKYLQMYNQRIGFSNKRKNLNILGLIEKYNLRKLY